VQGRARRGCDAIYDITSRFSWEDSVRARSSRRAVGDSRTSSNYARGCFRVGLIPSGSKDPFALRRAAQGIVKILSRQMRLPISDSVRRQSATGKEFSRAKSVITSVRFAGSNIRRGQCGSQLRMDDLLDVEERRGSGFATCARRKLRPLPRVSNGSANLKQAQFEGLETACRSVA